MVSKYNIDEKTMMDIANAYRKRQGKLDKATIAQMIADLKKERWINEHNTVEVSSYNDYEPWVRPAEWPDLDSLNLELSGDDFI